MTRTDDDYDKLLELLRIAAGLLHVCATDPRPLDDRKREGLLECALQIACVVEDDAAEWVIH